MKKQQALELLSKSKTLLQEKYGVTTLALFGSTARDTATENSDIDILIAFREKPTLNAILALYFISKNCSNAL